MKRIDWRDWPSGHWPTTRRFPRSMLEAFGCDGHWFYPHEDNRGWVDKALRWSAYFGWAFFLIYFFRG